MEVSQSNVPLFLRSVPGRVLIFAWKINWNLFSFLLRLYVDYSKVQIYIHFTI